jgi:hypothetical protein
MTRKAFFPLAALGLLVAATFPAWPADDIQPPSEYRHWFHVNTMIIDKASPLFKDLGGAQRLRQRRRRGSAEKGQLLS